MKFTLFGSTLISILLIGCEMNGSDFAAINSSLEYNNCQYNNTYPDISRDGDITLSIQLICNDYFIKVKNGSDKTKVCEIEYFGYKLNREIPPYSETEVSAPAYSSGTYGYSCETKFEPVDGVLSEENNVKFYFTHYKKKAEFNVKNFNDTGVCISFRVKKEDSEDYEIQYVYKYIKANGSTWLGSLYTNKPYFYNVDVYTEDYQYNNLTSQHDCNDMKNTIPNWDIL